MIDLKEKGKEVIQNKKNKGFNTTDVKEEFLYLYGEVGEAFMAWLKKEDDLGEELADVAIYLLGICEILDIDLEKEIEHKILKNSKREYTMVNGILRRTKEYDG